MVSKSQPYTIQGYPVRESRRARRIRVQVATSGDVEVVVPTGYRRSRVTQFLRDKQAWIEQTQGRMINAQQGRSPETRQVQPSYIFLRALDQLWVVEYRPTAASGIQIRAASNHLQLSGAIHQVSLCQTALQQWVRHKAKGHLVSWLDQVSREIRLPYKQATIRRQKTRWGSCSSRKSINLNDKLLFLSPELVRYVLVHELCHTVHLNHSAAFWALVGQWEPEYRDLDRQLKDGWQYVPDWLTAR
ncbi:MAG: SprT family zinc-dependent metalloprotease [Elainellaceae cyanobacterium]